jgi:membrane protease YdiL (CAAX protease family)
MSPAASKQTEDTVKIDDDPEPPRPADPLRPTVEPAEPIPLPRELPAKFVPEDLRAPWGWLDLVLFALVSVAGAVVLGILVFLAFTAFGVTIAELRASPRTQGIFNVASEVLLFSGLIGYLALQIRVRFHSPFWRTVGWRPLKTGPSAGALTLLGFIAGGFVLALFVQVVSAVFGTKAKLPIEALFQDRLTALLILLLAVLMAPLVEETIFRGYIYPVVARSFGRGVGVVATGTLFGLLHAAQLWGGWTQIALLVFVGLVLTFVRAATKTVLASYLLHLSYNFTVSVGFLVGSHWLKVLPPGP